MTDKSSEQHLQSTLAQVEEWHAAFAQSPEFAGLSPLHQRKAGAITEFFARYTHEYLGLAPDQWDGNAVVECCTEILPQKVSAEPAFFKAMAPVLRAFFGFLKEQSLHSNAGILAEVVEELEEDIVASAEDRSNWGPAKHYVMAAHDSGVDINDLEALKAFMLEFNQQQFARATSKGATPASRSFHGSRATAKPVVSRPDSH